ncbi:hypothetical protein [Pontibacter beigongshangensis]|uniref:hypothetical protein n=1 Tax=Pontibacter beigongshangensis TaxID=2574733 RepID=UPI00164EFADA|nr:hypothetical protein [Pontibacter beigongshangensis]
MIEQTPYRRGGVDWIEHRGTDEAGDFWLFHREVNPNEDGLYRQHEPASMSIQWIQGKLKVIVTQWQEVWITKSGRHTPIPPSRLDMTTNQYDTRGFVAIYGGGIAKSMSNGEIRAILGFDEQPLYNSVTGERIPDSAYDTAAFPTHTYHFQRDNNGAVIHPTEPADESPAGE